MCKSVAKTSFLIFDYWDGADIRNNYYWPFPTQRGLICSSVVHNLYRDPTGGELLHIVATTVKGGRHE